ncbi:unnamed protein product, partial [Acidithrix sp. C25]
VPTSLELDPVLVLEVVATTLELGLYVKISSDPTGIVLLHLPMWV